MGNKKTYFPKEKIPIQEKISKKYDKKFREYEPT